MNRVGHSLLHNRLAWTFGIAVSLFLTAPAFTAPGQSRANAKTGSQLAAANEVLVKFRTVQSPDERAFLEGQLDADRDREIGGNGVRRIHSRSLDVASLLARLTVNPAVEYAEPNYVVQSTGVPNDLQFSQLWGLQNLTQVGADIGAVAAWDISTGSSATVVAVVDTGTDYTHQDLTANMWTAPSAFTVTIGGVSITCAAGTHGFNAITNVCDPMDDNNHGTHTAGTIGATGNNAIGVVGVNWTTSIMPLKFLDASGSGSIATAVNAIEFAIQAKKAFGSSGAANVRVLSNSWGGGGSSQSLLDEINRANTSDMLFVAAAGNSGANNDTTPFYPASYTAPNVIAVAATDGTDFKASFSNFGAASVHLGAPGVSILSTTIGNSYQVLSGTSMAAPHVAGAAALVLSHCALDTAGVKNTLLSTVDQVGSLTGLTVTGGRLNVNNAIRGCALPGVPAAPTGLTALGGNATVTLNWTGSSGATSYLIQRGTTPGSEAPIASGVPSTAFTDSSVTNGMTYYYVVSAQSSAGISPNSNETSVSPAAPSPGPSVVAPAAPTNLTATAGRKKITLSWGVSTGATSYVLMRSTSSGGPYSQIASGLTGTTYQNSGLKTGMTYQYVVAAVNAAGISGNSNQAGATVK
jgi:subtilisin family serine protease